MKLSQLLSADRVAIHAQAEAPLDKGGAVRLLARLLAEGAGADAGLIERALLEREDLQSTGIGEGVAMPHAAIAEIDAPIAALLTTRAGVEFDAIDGADVTLLLAVIGPRAASGENLRTLARVSRVLRSSAFREELLLETERDAVYEALVAEEEAFVR